MSRSRALRFSDRTDAGRRLAAHLTQLLDRDTCRDGDGDTRRDGDGDIVVVGLPRGGVPVAYEVARALTAPLDVILVRKLGVPWQPELGMGAIGEGGGRVINRDVLEAAEVSEDELAAVEKREQAELQRRIQAYRTGRPRVALSGKVVVVVDDGIATGSTARVACRLVRAEGARRIIVAVPVAPPDFADRLADVADELVSVITPDELGGIGRFYRDFSQLSDAAVVDYLERGAAERTRSTGPRPGEEPPGRARSSAG